jgi:hypothetical protein
LASNLAGVAVVGRFFRSHLAVGVTPLPQDSDIEDFRFPVAAP